MIEINLEVSNAVLKEAIELRICECFPALNFANSLGGTETMAWKLVRKYGLVELVEEALDRGLPVGDFKSSVEGTRFIDCKLYMRVREQIGGRADFPK